MNDRIEIRMFGRLLVRRGDGTLVDPDEWRTGKTADLLRLLALKANRHVSVSGLIDKLWPDVDEAKARASLRTAASTIRRVLGSSCIERHLGGLVLRGVWVDVVTFQATMQEAKTARHNRDHARVVELALEAEALYVADFQAFDDKSGWAIETRESIKMARQSMLADAAESSVQLLWMRNAIDFATLAIAEDNCFERAYRTLMLAHTGLGEVELALRAFERCRLNLAQELGADPSPQTRALHIQIISGEIEEISLTPFTGRDDEVHELAEDIRDSIAHDGCDVICLTGTEGSGRGALLQAAIARVPRARLRRLITAGGSPSSLTLTDMLGDRRSDIVLWPPADGNPLWESVNLVALIATLDPAIPRNIAVLTSDETADLLEVRLAETPHTMRRRRTGPISESDLAELANVALSGPPTLRLLSTLREQSDGLAGSAISILREWLASGWIIWTHEGLDLYNDAEANTAMPHFADQFRFLLEQLPASELEFCQLLAVMNRPVSVESVIQTQYCGSGDPEVRATVQSRLDALADYGALRVGPRGYEFRNIAVRDAMVSWLRPAVRAQLLRQSTEAGRQEGDFGRRAAGE